MTIWLIIVNLLFWRRFGKMRLMSKKEPKSDLESKELRLQVILAKEQLLMLDDIRKRHSPMPSRSALIRQMIEDEHQRKK
jgi:hypothetical protein